jgi:cytochrome c peroxidase
MSQKPEHPNRRRDTATMFLLCLVAFLLNPTHTNAASFDLEVRISPQHHGASLVQNSLTLTNSSGQPFSISRLDLLLSAFALRRSDGSWLEKTNWNAYVSLADKRLNVRVPELPVGTYNTVRYHVGLVPEVNHGNPAQYAADHPLNANLNGLHWSWADGYVFFAIEGHWRNNEGKNAGYSFHLGNDPMLMTVELPLALELNSDTGIDMSLAIEKVLDLQFEESTAATHSRKGDEVATRLKRNVERAFAATTAKPFASHAVAENPAARVLVAPTAKPYRFSFSAQFPMPDLPHDNPLTEEGVELGRQLFSESMLSKNNAQSCVSCHQPDIAFVDAGKRFSTGVDGKNGHRNSMPIFNLAWKKSFFWDGRAPTVRQQVLEPIQNPIEMHETLPNVVDKLSKTTNYPVLFQRAFGSTEINSDRVARALEQFLLSQVSFDSKFDRALEGKEVLSDEEKRGFQLFITEYDPRTEQYGADCFHCHGGPFFTTHGFANNGLKLEFFDFGRFEVTKNESDKLKFSVPSLRNIALTGPYMHDGRFQTLEEVIEHYATGVKRTTTLDPNLAKHPEAGLPLSDADKKALVAFLKTLTDEKYLSSRSESPQ